MQHVAVERASTGVSSCASRTSTYSSATAARSATSPRTTVDDRARRRARPSTTASAARRERARQHERGARGRSGERYALRLDIARPSGSRTIGQPTTSTGRLRSSAMRVITASCCASLRPKNAAHGPTIANSFVTTVVTPSKCVGRAAPHRSVGEAGDVHGRERRAARVHLGDRSARTRSRRPRPRTARGRRRGRAGSGRGPRSAPNCSGFTKIVTTTKSVAGAGRPHQRAVTLVQEAHRRHEPDASGRRRARVARGAQVGDRSTWSMPRPRSVPALAGSGLAGLDAVMRTGATPRPANA